MTPVVEMKKAHQTPITTETQTETKPVSLKERVLLAIEQIKNRKIENAQYVYGIIMNSTKQVGNKTYAYIPVEYCFVDDRFQRCNLISVEKICKLIINWDKNKMDALKAVPHPEDNQFSIVDGFHRLVAAIVKGEHGLEAELILGLSENPKERLIQEATIFSTQNDQVDPMKPVEKHKADVLRGIKDAIIIDNLINKYSIPLNEEGKRGRGGAKKLSGYDTARDIAKIYGEQTINDIFYIICESRWNLEYYGLGTIVIRNIKNMLVFHPEHRHEVVTELIKFCKYTSPKLLFASAMDKYPLRTETERISIYLEDYLCEKIGMERTYTPKRKTTKVA